MVRTAPSNRGSISSTSPWRTGTCGRMYDWAHMVRNETTIPTITVGNVSTGDQVNTLVLSGRAERVALARPHLSLPSFTLGTTIEQGYRDLFIPKPYLSVRPLPPP